MLAPKIAREQEDPTIELLSPTKQFMATRLKKRLELVNANFDERSENGYVKIAPKCDGRLTIIQPKTEQEAELQSEEVVATETEPVVEEVTVKNLSL